MVLVDCRFIVLETVTLRNVTAKIKRGPEFLARHYSAPAKRGRRDRCQPISRFGALSAKDDVDDVPAVEVVGEVRNLDRYFGEPSVL